MGELNKKGKARHIYIMNSEETAKIYAPSEKEISDHDLSVLRKYLLVQTATTIITIPTT